MVVVIGLMVMVLVVVSIGRIKGFFLSVCVCIKIIGDKIKWREICGLSWIR